MRDSTLLFIHFITNLLKMIKLGGVRAVMAESLLMKQQLITLHRSRQRAPKLTYIDRFLFGWFSLLINPARLAKVAVIIKPATLLRFHRALVKRKYRQLFSSRYTTKPGSKGPSQDVINTIVDIKKRNPRFDCQRIAYMISNTFGIDINKDAVRRVPARHYKPPSGGNGPSWLTLIGQAKDSLWSVDLFRCESILLQTHWVMIMMDQYSRRIIAFCCAYR